LSKRSRTMSLPKSKKTACETSSFLQRKGGSPTNRAYTIVGVSTARWVLRRRSTFTTDQVKVRRLVMVTPSVTRTWIVEFLSSWETPGPSHSKLADELVARCPQLHDKVIRFWAGH
jgi:hypothetical protein